MPCNFHLLPHEGIQTLHPYVPGKSAEVLAAELGITDIIKMASNENPLGCSPAVKKALAALTPFQLATYTVASTHPLHQQLADKLGVSKDMVLLGNGSDGIIPLLILCFALHRKRAVLTHEYAFISYQIHAQTLGVPIIKTPLLADWQVDMDALIAACDKDTALIFLANPNNPTGVPVQPSAIERLLKHIPSTTLLVLDEAYYEYTDKAPHFDALAALKKYPNLVVLRTFSKAYGLAGLRLGYLIAHPDITSILWRALPPFTVNEAALTAGLAALNDDTFLKESVQHNAEGIKQLQQGLEKLGFSYLKTAANFVLFDFKKNAGPLYQDLQRHGIIVRPLEPYGLPHHVRVSVGTFAQNKRFLEKLEELHHDQ